MKALVLSSGGVDSTTCLGLAVDKYGSDNVIALAITYGQRHTKEIEAAKAVAAAVLRRIPPELPDLNGSGESSRCTGKSV